MTNTKLTIRTTGRGFRVIEFEDAYGSKCSLQKSSLASEDAVWLGIEDAEPKIKASDALKMGRLELLNDQSPQERGTGWVPFPFPDEVQLSTRMHLTDDNIEEILPYLNFFAITGSLPTTKIVPSAAPVVGPINFGDNDTCDAKIARVEARLHEATKLQGLLHTPGIEDKKSKEELDQQRAAVRSCIGEIVAAFGLNLAE